MNEDIDAPSGEYFLRKKFFHRVLPYLHTTLKPGKPARVGSTWYALHENNTLIQTCPAGQDLVTGVVGGRTSIHIVGWDQ